MNYKLGAIPDQCVESNLNSAERNFLNKLNLNCPKCLNSRADLSSRCFPKQCFFQTKSYCSTSAVPQCDESTLWILVAAEEGARERESGTMTNILCCFICSGSCRRWTRIGWGRFLSWHKMGRWQGGAFGQTELLKCCWVLGTRNRTEPYFDPNWTERSGAFGWNRPYQKKKKRFFF